MNCNHCGAALDHGAKFCAECGSKSAVIAPATKSTAEPAQVYDSLLTYLRTLPPSSGPATEHRISTFKSLCRTYGNGNLEPSVFLVRLDSLVGHDAAAKMYDDLLYLIPDPQKRESLYSAMQSHSESSNDSATGLFDQHDPQEYARTTSRAASVASSSSSNSTTVASNHHPHETRSSSIWKGPHNWGTDNKGKTKACGICQKEFHWMRRRHQCRCCAGFYCDKDMKFLMIPEGKEHSDAKQFDGNEVTPQRVCLNCSPDLEGLQQELGKGANSHRENEGKFSRVPYMNNTMDMEIASAARSLQRFFNTGVFYTGFIKDNYIPVKLLKDAKGIALFTNYKIGFIVSGAGGTGLAIARRDDGSWSAPIALAVHSLSVGLKAGLEFAYYLLVLRSDKAVKSLASGSVGLDASADIAIGPFGRAANASAGAGKGGVATSLMYAHCRGLYGGISLGGQMLRVRKDVNRAFYGRDVDPTVILTSEPVPRAAKPLYDAIETTFEQARVLEQESVTSSSEVEFDPWKDPPPPPVEESKSVNVPEKAIGEESNRIYKHVIKRVKECSKDDSVVAKFKSNCRDYGLGKLSASSFCSQLEADIGRRTFIEIMPDMVRLIPDYDKRKDLVDCVNKGHRKKKKKPKSQVESKDDAAAAALHASIIKRVRDATNNNEEDVATFKRNCKNFGLSEISAEEFYTSLYYSLGPTECASVVPDLVKLIPNAEKQTQLLDLLHGR